MKKSEKQLRAFIRESIGSQYDRSGNIGYMITQPNQVQKSLPHSYQFKFPQSHREAPEEYLSDEQKEKYGDKIATLRGNDPHQTDALVAPLVGEEPSGFYDKLKAYTEEMETIARIHDEEVPDRSGGTIDRNFDDSIPPFMLNLRGYTNKEVNNLFMYAKNIWVKTVNDRTIAQGGSEKNVGYFHDDLSDRTRLYKYMVKLVYSRDVISAAANLQKYLSSDKYKEDRKDLATFADGRAALKLIRSSIKSLKKQYKDAMKYYHSGNIPQRHNK